MLRNLITTLLVLIAFASIMTVPALAQSATGSISGRVADSAGAVLQGARITMAQKDVYSVSNGIGEFFITGLAPGEYDLTVSYVGFAPFSKKVTVVAGKVTRADAVMAVAAQNQSITVTADRPLSEAEAINRQIAADNILQVEPNQVINSLPNATIADAAGRMPGVSLERDEGEGKYIQIRGAEPRLNNLTIDGISIPSPEAGVREVKLDTIPANLVDSIEISKTLSANQDADAIGGSVNLVTKTAGEQPTIDIGGMGGYTHIQNGRGMDLLDGTIGERFGPNKRWGVLLGGSYDYNSRGIDDIEPAPDPASRTPLYDSMDIREYAYNRTRYGFAGSTDYKLGDGSSIYLRGLFSSFQDYGEKWVYTLNNYGAPTYSNESRAPDYEIASASVGAKHVFASSWLAWNFAASRSSQTAAAGNPGVDFAPLTNSTLSSLSTCVFSPAATVTPYRPQWAGCDQVFGGLNQYGLVDYITTSGITAQVNLAGDVSYAKNFHIGSHFSTFQIGANVRNEHKGQNAFAPEYCPMDNPMCQNGNPSGLSIFQGNMFQGTFTNPNYYGGSYTLGPLTEYNNISSFFNANGGSAAPPCPTESSSAPGPSPFCLNQSLTALNSWPANFDLVQRVSAGYVMDTIDFGRFRLQAGVRFEGTQLGTQGFVVTNDSNGNFTGVSSVTNGYTYVDVLPSANLRYRLTDDSALRLFYGRGISRPDPMELVPYVQVDQSTNPYSISVGNPALKPEHANNFDLLYEHYLKPLGVLQGGVFYKDLSTPLYQFLFPVLPAQLPECPSSQTTCNETQWQNGASAKLYGLEVSYQQYLSFLPGLLHGLGVSANYTWTGSEAADLPGRTGCAAEGLPTSLCARPALQRQAPDLFNISPTYTRGRLFVSVGMSYNGSSIYQYAYATANDPSNLGPKGPAGDVYFYPHFQLDAQGSFRLPKGFTFQLAGLNITNEVFGFYMGSPQYVLQREYYGPTIQAGLRWSPPREKK